MTTESHFLRSSGLNQNRRTYGDSSLILDSLDPLSEKPTALAVGSSLNAIFMRKQSRGLRPQSAKLRDPLGVGSNPSTGHQYALLAQLVEHAAVNRSVIGSSPIQGSNMCH